MSFCLFPRSSPGSPRCDQRRRRSPFTHDVVTVSHPHLISAQRRKMRVFAYSCRSSTSSATASPIFFFFLLFSRVADFPPKYLSRPLCFLSPFALLSLPSKLLKKTKNPYHWLPWDPVAMRQRGFHMVLACVRVYCSVTDARCHVDWEEEEC